MRDNRASEGYERVPNGVGNEVLLQFIWQFRYFNHRELTTEAGESLAVHHPGDRNTDQGPDFKNARITIGDTFYAGPVELHIKASDWVRHHHTGDPHYQKVILHVVWVNDTPDPPACIPILELQHRTPKPLLPRFHQLMTSQSFVPCERLLPADIHWSSFRDRLLHQRLGQRTAFIRTLIDEHRPHWEETLYWLITRSLGQPVNTDAFLAIARTLPLKSLLRHRTDRVRLETLLLDQAARLPQPLSFHRMRPAHSPYTRLRQLAALLSNHSGWFTLLLESDHPVALLKTLDTKGLGTQIKHSILINAYVPLLYAYGTLRQEPRQREKALRWLQATTPEDNAIIRRWREMGLPAATAADTQALLELRKSYCSGKKCLDCTIGQSLLAMPSPASESLPSPPDRDEYCT
jgi:hypothetical protein